MGQGLPNEEAKGYAKTRVEEQAESKGTAAIPSAWQETYTQNLRCFPYSGVCSQNTFLRYDTTIREKGRAVHKVKIRRVYKPNEDI